MSKFNASLLVLQVVTTRDIRSLFAAGLMLLFILAVGVIFRRRLKGLLTPGEWRVFFKLVAIIVMALVLIFTSIAVEFPAEQFIYGRF
jgi:hypothetical protein